MRHFFRVLMRVLVLTLVFLASALTAMRFAIHGREVAVPKFVGMAPADAERLAIENGLLFRVDDRFYSADVPEGRIVSQVPQAGARVRRGWRVRVAQSLGRQRVVIPSVIGQSMRAAEINLGRRGLAVGNVAVAQVPGFPPDQVIAQSPTPNAADVATPKVNLLMTPPQEQAEQAFVMPNLSGRALSDVEKMISDAGFQIGKVAVIPPVAQTSNPAQNGHALKPLPTDKVVRQVPAAGQKIISGATIGLEVTR
jgi:beta-lactam-binding protein with PASTA domain